MMFQSMRFLDRVMLLTRKLLHQEFQLAKMKSSLRKFYEYHHDLVASYGISVSKLTTEGSTCRKQFMVLSSFMIYHRICS